MQDYASLLLNAINNYDPDNAHSIETLRDLVCWISDNETLKKDKLIAELLYIASQKMRVFGYNILNKFKTEPIPPVGELGAISAPSVTNLYRSKVYSNNILDKTQQEVVDLFQSLANRRLLVSAPTSYGKTFLMREIVFLNKERYNNILLVFPTVALLLENARMMEKFVLDHNLDYKIIKTVDEIIDDNTKRIFVFTPERALQLIANYPNFKIDFFFYDEIYKIDEDYCNEGLDEGDDEVSTKTLIKASKMPDFLNEDRGKTFRIALYLLAKTVEEYYLAGPNLNKEKFGLGMRRFIKHNNITIKEISFEPTLRISVNAYGSRIKEVLPGFVMESKHNIVCPIQSKINDKIKNVIAYINKNKYGKTLLYCTSPKKAMEYSNKLVDSISYDNYVKEYPQNFQDFIDHIKHEYDIDGSSEKWSLIKVLMNGFGMHHGKLPKYIQHEILDQFNKGAFDILFCTSTIVEGVNTDAQNMIILNSSKGTKKLTQFDIKNIKGRAGRYYHCFIGRVFYMNRELIEIEKSDDISLDFVTFSNKPLSSIDLDSAEKVDLTDKNVQIKLERDEKTSKYLLPQTVFIKNRTVSKENQEKLINCFMKNEEYRKLRPLLLHPVNVENFLEYRWINKILKLFFDAGLINEYVNKKYSAVANNYYEKGFKGILEYELSRNSDDVDRAYSETFKSLRDILEHKIPKILSLFESIAQFILEQKEDYFDDFSLSNVRRYYETGVKSAIGEALSEYGFPTDAIRRIEDRHIKLSYFTLSKSKEYCLTHYENDIENLLDKYENQLFIKALNAI